MKTPMGLRWDCDGTAMKTPMGLRWDCDEDPDGTAMGLPMKTLMGLPIGLPISAVLPPSVFCVIGSAGDIGRARCHYSDTQNHHLSTYSAINQGRNTPMGSTGRFD